MSHRPRENTRWTLWAGCLLVGVAAAGCATGAGGGGGGNPPPDEGVTEVSIQNIAFSPKEVTIRRGETVRWTNLEGNPIPHTVTSGNPGEEDVGALFDQELNPDSQPFSRTFNEVGEFTYFCRIHSDDPDMVGATVTVTEE